MTSLQKAEQKIKDLKIQNENLKTQLKHQKEYYEEKIENMEKNFNKKFDAIMTVVEDLKNKVATLTKENEELKNKVKILEDENAELRKENDILKGKAIQKNSSNSNIPPSKDENKIQNHREKSSKKQGGQKGRKGKTLTSKEVEKLIEKGSVEVVEEHYGNENARKTVVKYIIDVKTKVIVRKIYIHGNIEEKSVIKVPEECKNKSSVIYGNNLKALVAIMYVQEVIVFDRMAEFLNILTDDILNVSHGSLISYQILRDILCMIMIQCYIILE